MSMEVIKTIDFFVFNYLILFLMAILTLAIVFTKKTLSILLYMHLMSILVCLELILFKAYIIAVIEFVIGTVFIEVVFYFLFKVREIHDKKDML